MQTLPIRRLAHFLRSTERKTKSWRTTAAIHHVLCDDGQPNPGLAYRIANWRYMPPRQTMQRLYRDGAIELEAPEPLVLSESMRRAIFNALKERKPLPPPDRRTIREFDRWLERGRISR